LNYANTNFTTYGWIPNGLGFNFEPERAPKADPVQVNAPVPAPQAPKKTFEQRMSAGAGMLAWWPTRENWERAAPIREMVICPRFKVDLTPTPLLAAPGFDRGRIPDGRALRTDSKPVVVQHDAAERASFRGPGRNDGKADGPR
jgi:hypothetical protein